MELPNLITNRSYEDIEIWEKLKTKMDSFGFNALSESEQSLWLTNLKGAYNYTDLNRVGLAIQYLGINFTDLISHITDYLAFFGVASDDFFTLPYKENDVNVNPKTNWNVSDNVFDHQMINLIADLYLLKSLITLPLDTPNVPNSMDNLTVELANDIEKLLQLIDEETIKLKQKLETQIINTSLAWFYAGEVFSTEV